MKRIYNVMVIAAHPDEADMYAGGLAALCARRGDRVKFVSLTNGDCGHQLQNGDELIRRRKKEADAAAAALGIAAYDVLDIHDGELETDVSTRRKVIQLIREWSTDVVIAFHPEGPGHVDNRNAGRLVRDAIGFVYNVPQYMPEVPSLQQMPWVLLMPDYAMKSLYRPDCAVNVHDVMDRKLAACAAHASQFFEFAPWQMGFLDQVPDDRSDCRDFLLQYWDYCLKRTGEMDTPLQSQYGTSAVNVEFAEAYEIADYARMPEKDELEDFLSF